MFIRRFNIIAVVALALVANACIHGEPKGAWTYTESTHFVTEPDEPKIKVHAVCREGEFWFGKGEECFTTTCVDGGECETSGDPAIVTERQQATKTQKVTTAELLKAKGGSCKKAQWHDCAQVIEALFQIKSYKEAQSLKNEACAHRAIECRYVAKAKMRKLVLKRGEKLLWKRDLRSTWGPDMFFDTGSGRDGDFVEVMILRP